MLLKKVNKFMMITKKIHHDELYEKLAKVMKIIIEFYYFNYLNPNMKLLLKVMIVKHKDDWNAGLLKLNMK